MENNDKNLVAYCGLYCGACSFKLAFDENNRCHLQNMPKKYDPYKESELQFCPGCRLDNQCDSNCAIRNCAISKELFHCGLCGEFPCEKISSFNNDDKPHHSESIENLRELSKIGINDWISNQKDKWECHSCGAKKSWYLKECISCGKSFL